MKTYSMYPTDEQCWLHRGMPLRYVEMSDGTKGLYCPECRGPSHPRQAPEASAAMERYERRLARRSLWRRLSRLVGWK